MDRTPRWICGCLAALLLIAAPAAADHHKSDSSAGNEFKPIFNGKDLTGWDGKDQLWSVEDGAITGETTKEHPTDGNTFIVWQGGEVDDFELKFTYRIRNHNSGVQYRSKHLGNFVCAGYQADFEAGTTWSGTNYEEKRRGILAKRGQKVVIHEDGEKEVVGSVGDPKELQKHIDRDGWNQYHVIAKGPKLVQKINGHVMSVVTDHGPKARRSGIIALQLHAGPPMKVQMKDVLLKRLPMEDKKKIVFIAGSKSHGYGAHEHKAGCMLLAEKLNNSGLPVHAEVYTGGWPKHDPTALDNADAVVVYCDGGGGHIVRGHYDRMDKFADNGGGVAMLHYAVEIPEKEGDHFLDWIGGYFEAHYSVNPHWTASYDGLPDHAITRGVEPFEIHDEWYYHMRFREGMEGVTPLLTDMPPRKSLRGWEPGDKSKSHHGNPHVYESVVEEDEPQHTAWALRRDDGGRGFGFTGGHFHWNWGHDDFRRFVLNALVWTAGGEVPSGGVPSETPTVKELEKNQDYPKPDNWSREPIRTKLNKWNGE